MVTQQILFDNQTRINHVLKDYEAEVEFCFGHGMIHKSVPAPKVPHLVSKVCLIMLWKILGTSLRFVESWSGLVYSGICCGSCLGDDR
jgi:hypothetical protein